MTEQEVLALLKRAAAGDGEAATILKNMTVEEASAYSEATQMEIADFWDNTAETLPEFVKCMELYNNFLNSTDELTRNKAMLHNSLSCLAPILDNASDEDTKKRFYNNIVELALQGFGPASLMLADCTEKKYNPKYFNMNDTEILFWYAQAVKQGIPQAKDGLARFAKKLGKCTYCGGELKGLFTKKCQSCKKKKAY